LFGHPEGIRARDALAEVEERLGLTEYEAANYPGSDIRRFEKTVRFQTINAVKAGWMVKEAGVWTATEEGFAAYRAYTDPEQFLVEAQKLYRAWEAAQQPPEEDEEEEQAAASITVELAEEASWNEVRQVLGSMDPHGFQALVAGLLRGMGYHVSWVSPPGKDRGIDIVALADPIGTKGPRVKVQVKREKGKSDAPTLRAFYSVLHDGEIGVFVSLGGFTSDAATEARSSTRHVRLIDDTEFFRLWVSHYDDIPDEDRRRLPIKSVAFLAPGYSN
jgi:restriction system protein